MYVLKFLYPLLKDSHWETEKAGYENADCLVYMMQVTRPALILFRPCLKSIGIMFLHPKIFGALFLVQIVTLTEKLSCGNFLHKNCRSFFICPAKKERGYQNEIQKTTLFTVVCNYDYCHINSIARKQSTD